jgi:hypothetical protein
MAIREVIVGKRFARLVVLDDSGVGKDRRIFCRCDCGNEKSIIANHVRTGRIRSCGCLQREIAILSNTIHGHNRIGQRTSEYRIWYAMKDRTLNPKSPAWDDYGGRGITVCDRWRDSFEAFLADMGPRPSGLTLDRKNNDGNYEPGNCRWATWAEQNNNRRPQRSSSMEKMA